MCAKSFLSALGFSKIYLTERLKFATAIVDATCGNGHDTLFIARNCRSDARIVAMDIQQLAVAATVSRLEANGLQNLVRVVHDSYENICDYFERLDLAVFNLGYLPGADHAVTTSADTLLRALPRALQLLDSGGAVVVVGYPGHTAGRSECHELGLYLANLSQKAYNCACFEMLNQVNYPPRLYIIEKR